MTMAPDTRISACRASSDFKVTRWLLALMAGSFVITVSTFQTLFSLLTVPLFLPLAVVSLLAAPVIIVQNRNRKSLYYAAVLILSVPAWVFGTQWIAKTAMEINHQRARAFIAEVGDHVGRTGTLPATKHDLEAANIKVPSAMLGFEMRYRRENLSAWPFFVTRTETDGAKPGTEALAFTISFEAGVLVSCTHTAWNNSVYCDD